MEDIKIIYASDINFINKTYVSIYSVLSARKYEYKIDFFIMVPQDSCCPRYDKRWPFNNYSISFIEVDEQLFESNVMTISHITKPTYYRLLIPRIFGDLSRVLYLDGDTICCNDIRDLYNQDIGDNYIGGCLGELLNWNQQQKDCIASRLGIESADNYINAGVLLINVNQSKKLTSQFIEEAAKNYAMQDQDVINKCCHGKIKILPPKYNLYSWTSNLLLLNENLRYDEEQIKEAMNQPCIVHYANEFTKPWINNNCIMHNEWWSIAEKALPVSVVNKLKDNRDYLTCFFSHEHLIDIISKSRGIAIYGYANLGKEFRKLLNATHNSDRIIMICDNDSTKWGVDDGVIVCDPERIEKSEAEYIVITSHNYWSEIYDSLIARGINKSRILIYRKKSKAYYIGNNLD